MIKALLLAGLCAGAGAASGSSADPRRRRTGSSSGGSHASSSSSGGSHSSGGSVNLGSVKIGLIHALSGSMQSRETPLYLAELIAIEEINAKGGLLGRTVEPYIADTHSLDDDAAMAAENFTAPNSEFLTRAVFGCWSTSCRQRVTPVFERNNHMFWFPVHYEGQECSKYIFYTGAVPNQQVEPAMDWLTRFKSKEVFLVGTGPDYVFTHTVDYIAREELWTKGAKVLGEALIPYGATDDATVQEAVDAIMNTMPNGGSIFSSIFGYTNAKFYELCYNAGMRPANYPIMSVSITEREVKQVLDANHAEYMEGHYAAWNFYMSLYDEPECDEGFSPVRAKEFIDNYHDHYGNDTLVTDPMESAYVGIHLWSRAVQAAGTFDIDVVRSSTKASSFVAPQGEVHVNVNHHISKWMRIGQIDNIGQFRTIAQATHSIEPEPWNQYLPDSKGYHCDWSDYGHGEKYKLDVVEVGLLHHLTGELSKEGKERLDAELAVIKDINGHGGLLSKTILTTIVDGRSEDELLMDDVARLATDPNGPVCFFGSVESDDLYQGAVAGTRMGSTGPPLLLSSGRSFGGKCSEYVLHFGSLINQQLFPAVEHMHERAVAGGSEDEFYVLAPSSLESEALEALKDHITDTGAHVAGSRRPASGSGVAYAVRDLKAKMPLGGITLNLLGGDLLTSFFQEMIAENMQSGMYPTVMTEIEATELKTYGQYLTAQHYVCAAYFRPIDTLENQIFLRLIMDTYGTDYVVSDRMNAAHDSVRMWESAVNRAGTFRSRNVRASMYGVAYHGPSGYVTLQESNYLSKPFRMGAMNDLGTAFRITMEETYQHRPKPMFLYPHKTKQCKFMEREVCSQGQHFDAYTLHCVWCPPGTVDHLDTTTGDVDCAPASWTYTGQIRVGIMHSLTGYMAISERPVVNAELMAIQEINDLGGLLGMKIVADVKDGASNNRAFADHAENFTDPAEKGYSQVVFGCWTSACRKMVMPIFEQHDHMLWYPVHYEGQECSEYIFYTGAVPNQQIEPALDWLMHEKGKQFYLIGSDSVYARYAHEIIKAQVQALGGRVLQDTYLLLNEHRKHIIVAAVDDIKRVCPHGCVVFNTLTGDTNVDFYRLFQEGGLRSDTYPIMSVSVSETEVYAIGANYLEGHYATWNYFESTKDAPDCDEGFDPLISRKFVENYQNLHGSDEHVSDPMEAAYVGVHMWARAVQLAGTFEIPQVRRAAMGQAFDAPQGEVVMQGNHHLSKFVRIGEIQAGGDFKIIYQSAKSIYPEPWNQYVSYSRGHACDFMEGGQGSFYEQNVVKVGLLHNLVSDSEKGKERLDSELAVIRDVNRRGGLIGKLILTVIIGDLSEEDLFLAKVTELSHDEDGPVIFFGDVMHDNAYELAVDGTRMGSTGPPLLMSASRTFGGQCSEAVLHFGSLPNQQLLPAVQYMHARNVASGLASEFYIMAPLTLEARALSELEVYMGHEGATVAGSRRPGSASGVRSAVDDVEQRMPNGGVIINLLHGGLLETFFEEMISKGMAGGIYPVVFTEVESTDLVHKSVDGGDGHHGLSEYLTQQHYVTGAYFAAIDSMENQIFLQLIADAYGVGFKVDDTMQASHDAVRMWVMAVEVANSFRSRNVRAALYGHAYDGPAGRVQLHESNYVSKPFRLGTINEKGTAFRITEENVNALAPEPLWIYHFESDTTAARCRFMDREECVSGQFFNDVTLRCEWCVPGTVSQFDDFNGEYICVEPNWNFVGEVKVGLLHSITGDLSRLERMAVNAERMAIQEINDVGGLLGMKIVPVIADGESDPDVFIARARDLTEPNSAELVSVVFGCWTSQSRRSVEPTFERNDHMLWYPLHYEGQECSHNVFYTGAAPNQQIEPAVDWLLHHKDPKFYLIGTDYFYPHIANDIIQAQLDTLGGRVVGINYIKAGLYTTADIQPLVDLIAQALPDGGVIFNTLSGKSNVEFYRLLPASGITPATHTVLSVTITETEVAEIGSNYLEGHYVAHNYFMSTKDAPECDEGFDPLISRKFVEHYQQMFGAGAVVNDPMESAYIAVHMWGRAVQLAGTFEIPQVRRAATGQAFDAPQGEVHMRNNHHLAKFVRIGKLTPGGDIEIVFQSAKAVDPEPWNQYMNMSKGYHCDFSEGGGGSHYKLTVTKIGLLHHLTGELGKAGRESLDTELAVIKDINVNGGIMDRLLEAEIINGHSQDELLIENVRDMLMGRDPPVVFFGDITDDDSYTRTIEASTNDMMPLLLTGHRSFGGKCSQYVLHFGSLINKQLFPAVKYMHKRAVQGGQDSLFYVVAPARLEAGSLAVLVVNMVDLGTTVTGQRRVLVEADISPTVQDIVQRMPDGGTIINMLGGMLSLRLFEEKRNLQLSAGRYPTVSTEIEATDTYKYGTLLSNHYVAFAHFEPIQNVHNQIFTQLMRDAYGNDYVISDRMASAYDAMRMWAAAAEEAKTYDGTEVREAMYRMQYEGPSGRVVLHTSNYLGKASRIGTPGKKGYRIAEDAQDIETPDPLWLFPDKELRCRFKEVQCADGQRFDRNTEECVFCQVGTYQINNECRPCPAGQVAPLPGMQRCDPCRPGSFSDVMGGQECQLCPLHHYTSELGQSECIACPAGTATDRRGATRKMDCTCPKYHFYPCDKAEGCEVDDEMTGDNCQECMTGMVCAGGSEISADGRELHKRVTMEPGYWAPVDDPQSVYECRRPTTVCPGGLAGTCAAGHHGDAMVCIQCKAGHFPVGDGTCEPCDAASGLPFVVVIIAVIAFICSAHYIANVDPMSLSHNALLGGIMAGITIGCLQVTSVFMTMTMEWVEPLASLIGAMEIFTFNLQLVKVSCVVESTPLVVFMMKVLIIPFSFIVLVLFEQIIFRLHATMPNQVKLPCAPEHRLDALRNTSGVIFLVFFIAVAMVTLSPMQCYTHPNMHRSLITYPNVECDGQGAHLSMVIVGIFATIIFPVAFMAATFMASWQYPRRMMRADFSFFRRYQFLFIRFQARRYWYGATMLTRNLLIAFTPIIEQTPEQMLFLGILLTVSLFGVAWYKPWKVRAANVYDGSLTTFLLLTLCVGGILYKPSEDADTSGVQIIALCLVLLVAFAFLSAAGFLFYGRFVKGASYYCFITHAKSDSGARARLIKMLLERTAPPRAGTIYLDSDNLKNLEELFDTVRSHTRNLVVLATPAVFQRPWCAGEITCAYSSQIPVFLINFVNGGLEEEETNPVEKITDEFLDGLGQTFGADVPVLSENGVKLSDVEMAYKWLRSSVDVIQWPMLGRLDELQQVSYELCSRMNTGKTQCMPQQQLADYDLPPMPALEQVSTMLLSSNREGLASVRILQLLMPHLGYAMDSAPLQDFGAEGLDAKTLADLELHRGELTSCMLLLTKDLFSDSYVENILAFLIYAHCVQLKVILIHAAPEFSYPTQEFWESHSAVKSSQVVEAAREFGLDEDEVMDVFRSVFKNIALPVNLLGSMANIRHEAEGLCAELVAAHRAHNGDMSAAEEKAVLGEFKLQRADLEATGATPGIVGSLFSMVSGSGNKPRNPSNTNIVPANTRTYDSEVERTPRKPNIRSPSPSKTSPRDVSLSV